MTKKPRKTAYAHFWSEDHKVFLSSIPTRADPIRIMVESFASSKSKRIAAGPRSCLSIFILASWGVAYRVLVESPKGE